MIKLFYSKTFKNYICMMLTLFAVEIVFRLVSGFAILDFSLLRIFVGINIISLIFGALFSFCGRIAGNILTFISTLAFTIYGIAQLGFENYLGVYISLGSSSQAGAVKDYIADYFASFEWTFWLLLIPIALLLIFYIFFEKRIYIHERNEMIDFSDKFDSLERKKKNDERRIKASKKRKISEKITAVIFAGIFAGAFYATLIVPFMQNELQLKSNKELFLNPDMPNVAISQFGFSSYFFIDVKTTLIPYEGVDSSQVLEEYEKQEQVISDYTRYVEGDEVWEELISKETNSNFKTLHNYFISREITDKNDYTGIFNDKNVIVIMMESVNNVVLDERYYPNITRLYKEGWSWDNSYSPRNSCSTGNNETSGMLSLYSINLVCTANRHRNNVYPQALFNLFKNKGYTTSSFHNYTDQYYYRATIHPNMGSEHFYGVKELGIPYSNVYQEWPSDVELMEKVLSITEDQDKFMTWVTTVTSHQPYGQHSEFGDKYLDLFADTGYDITLKRYMSKLKELDNAIGVLLEGLEEQGKLEDTVLVLYADHYPYGLTNRTLNGYFDYDVSQNMEVDRTPFIIYNPSISATKYDEYTSYMNITPTLANLFNLEYDPRLYVGHDILSKDYENRVIFANGSWQDDKAFYNASTGQITYFAANTAYSAEEIKAINTEVRLRISMSNLAIKTNYFENLYKSLDELQADAIVDEEAEAENKEEPVEKEEQKQE